MSKDNGINEECPMLSERRVGEPVRVRIGDDLVVRRADGGIEHSVGYFSDPQRQLRAQFYNRLDEMFKKVLP